MTTHEWIRMRPGCKIKSINSSFVYEVIGNEILTKDGDPYTIVGNRVFLFSDFGGIFFLRYSEWQFSIVVEPKQEW